MPHHKEGTMTMPRLQSVAINLSEREQSILEFLAKGTHTPLHLKQRSKIILESAAGRSNSEIGRMLDIRRGTAVKWRLRYDKAAMEIRKRETDHPRELRGMIESVLQDDYRPGTPATFTNEQIAHILALSLQSPADHGVEDSHWTPSELARQAVKKGIAESISPRSVARFLKMGLD
jgi:putative transposase